MKKRRLIGLALSLLLVAVLISSAIVYAAAPDNPGKPDKQKPVPATNVELVKKVTVEGPGQGHPAKPPKPNKGKGGKEAATGILGATATGDRFAVVVGIADYPGEGNDLNYTDDDAEEMYLALTKLYGFPEANIVKLIDKEGTEASGRTLVATRYNILNAIESIGEVVTSDDEVVFFFSGHGVKGNAKDWDKERIDEGICVWGKDNEGNPILTYIWDGELQAEFSGFTEKGVTRIIFIFDTCLAGGMKKDLEASGRVIAMSTTENGSAYESDTWHNGEFSYYFVDQGMLQGMADKYDSIPDEADVTVEEAWDYAKANCNYDKPTIGDYFENDLLP